jgi:hypothetical protein
LVPDVLVDPKYAINVTPRRYLQAIDRFGRPDVFELRSAAVDENAVAEARRRLLDEP